MTPWLAGCALEPTAGGSPVRLLAILIGANLGPLITPWASLATLLWLERCRARGVEIPLRIFVLAGLVMAPAAVACAIAALAVS